MSIARHTALVVFAIGILLFTGCGRRHRRVAHAPAPQPRVEQPKAVPVGTTMEGVASWYGVPYDGRAAADGEIYHMEQLVAAHRTLPFNTRLRVTNLSNDRTVDVRVIDRGPFVGDRIIDLSKAAARQIEMIGPGIARVRLEVIAAPADVPANDFYGVQIGAFANRANADRLRAVYGQRYGAARITLKDGRIPLWRVVVGKVPAEAAAEVLAAQLRAELGNVFVVRLDAVEQPPAAPVSPDSPGDAAPQR